MWLSRAADTLNRIVRPLSRIFHGIGSVALALMMFLTAIDVSMRYFLDKPITGSFDLTEYMMVIVISLGLAYCAVEKEHVKVDLVISLFGPRTQAIINTITGFLSFVLFTLIAWQCIKYIKILYLSKVAYPVLLIPIYPSVAIVACGMVVLCLVLLANFLESLAQVIGR